ncbi:hypothetical protein HED49_23940 [Ochrobactrum daejeonense]|nr:hypothetical protein [Brucella daejeonensis]
MPQPSPRCYRASRRLLQQGVFWCRKHRLPLFILFDYQPLFRFAVERLREFEAREILTGFLPGMDQRPVVNESLSNRLRYQRLNLIAIVGAEIRTAGNDSRLRNNGRNFPIEALKIRRG